MTVGARGLTWAVVALEARRAGLQDS